MVPEALIRTYFEADRSAVRRKYEELFPPRTQADQAGATDQPAAEARESGDAQTAAPKKPREVPENATFDQVLEVMFERYSEELRLGAEVSRRLREVEPTLDIFDGAAVVHHLRLLREGKGIREYALEGLTNCVGMWLATHILHTLGPDTLFPIDADLPYPRLKAQLKALGIEVTEPPENASPAAAAIHVSSAVYQFADKHSLENWQIWALVYDLAPRLVRSDPPFPTSPAPRVWLTAAGGSNIEDVDSHQSTDRVEWSVNAKAKYGDFVLMYCTRPRSAIVAVYRCLTDAYRDPMNQSWTGVWAEIGEKLPIPHLTFKEMRADPVLKGWQMIKMQFQGLLNHAVPEEYWQRLQELVVEGDPAAGAALKAYAKSAEGVRLLRVSPNDLSEKEFEDTVMLPLLERLGWTLGKNLERQVEMHIKVGSGRPILARADFVAYSGALGSDVAMVIESKRVIRSSQDLEYAMLQAESYAGRMRCTRFAVASPQGLWAYDLTFPGRSAALNKEPIALTESAIEQLHRLIGFESARGSAAA